MLNDYFGRANIFISLVDEISIQKEWPAAELESALKVCGEFAIPKIIVIKKAGLKLNDTMNVFPVFQKTLNVSSQAASFLQPNIIEIKSDEDDKLFQIISQLHFPEYQAPGIIRGFLSLILGKINYLFVKPLGYFNLIGCQYGWVLGLFAFYYSLGDGIIWKSSYGVICFIFIVLILGFLIGSISLYIYILLYSYRRSVKEWVMFPFSLLGVLFFVYKIMGFVGDREIYYYNYLLIGLFFGWMYMLYQEYYVMYLKKYGRE